MKLKTISLGWWLLGIGFATNVGAFLVMKTAGILQGAFAFNVLVAVAYTGGFVMFIGWIMLLVKYLQKHER